MIGVYFSGTGNTKYCISRFLEYDNDKKDNEIYSTSENVEGRVLSPFDIRMFVWIHLA